MLERLVFFPFSFPASIGPPETKIVGMLRRAAAISSPGTFLSQFGTMTRPSKPWARTIASVESAMMSRVIREYFMPVCPMAMPSQTAIAGNMTGVPPAMATPSFTASTILSRFMCPGTISLWELTIPIIGRDSSSLVNPSAWYRLRCGALANPSTMVSCIMLSC